ncbi:MAG: hypothetical protein HY986_24775 [Candidatus Melainabacteria bacterium]|nr:hypothetical protein [Candidatus Melainabacteria bacterium]
MYKVNRVSKKLFRSQHSATVRFAAAAILLTAPPAFAAGLTTAQLNNVTLDAPDWEGDGVHQLKFTSGEYATKSGNGRILKTAVGDLDGDGQADGAVVYYENYGGSGAFMRMAVFICKDGKPVQVGMRSLGDRSETRHLTIKNRTLVLDIMTHRPNDSAPGPTKRKVVNFKLKQGKLVGPEQVDWN